MTFSKPRDKVQHSKPPVSASQRHSHNTQIIDGSTGSTGSTAQVNPSFDASIPKLFSQEPPSVHGLRLRAAPKWQRRACRVEVAQCHADHLYGAHRSRPQRCFFWWEPLGTSVSNWKITICNR